MTLMQKITNLVLEINKTIFGACFGNKEIQILLIIFEHTIQILGKYN